MMIAASFATLVAVTVMQWLSSLMVRNDLFARSEWGEEHQVPFRDEWRGVEQHAEKLGNRSKPYWTDSDRPNADFKS